jgi:23S rRNA (cytosine1962-C5)-methyltransferase
MAFDGLNEAWSNKRTLHRQGRYLLVDKPAGIACRSPDDGAARAFDLCARLAQQGLDGFEPCADVPERVSGVTLLAQREGSAPAEALRRSPPERSYLLGVEPLRLPAQGQLRGAPGAGTAAPLDYHVSRRQGPRALVVLRTQAGPESVARAFAAAGQPIVGDEASPAAATRLLLHVQRLQGEGLDVSAPVPSEFESWLLGASQRPPQQFEQALADAALVRAGLWPEHEAYRLLGEDAGEIAGITADRYAQHALLEISTDEAWAERARLAECLMDQGAQGVYVKRRLRADLRKHDPRELAPALPLCGSPAPESFCVRAGELAFWVRLGDGLATGLFLDQRENWQRVREGVRGTGLLNLFSYTGAFSVAAAAGGAATVSVDLSKRALARARLNLEHNGLSGPQHRLLADDVLVWLARARRAQRRFGWIVLDPPSFGTRRQGVLSAERDYAGLVASALELLEPGGRLLCVSHQLGFSQGDLRDLLRDALAKCGRAGSVESWVGGWDTPTLPGVSRTKSVLAQVAE